MKKKKKPIPALFVSSEEKKIETKLKQRLRKIEQEQPKLKPKLKSKNADTVKPDLHSNSSATDVGNYSAYEFGGGNRIEPDLLLETVLPPNYTPINERYCTCVE